MPSIIRIYGFTSFTSQHYESNMVFAAMLKLQETKLHSNNALVMVSFRMPCLEAGAAALYVRLGSRLGGVSGEPPNVLLDARHNLGQLVVITGKRRPLCLLLQRKMPQLQDTTFGSDIKSGVWG